MAQLPWWLDREMSVQTNLLHSEMFSMFLNYLPILCQFKNSLRIPIAVWPFLPPIVYFRNSAWEGWLDALVREMVFTTWKNQVKKWELRIPCLYHLSASSNKDKICLYHHHLGHPSFDVFKIMFPSLFKGWSWKFHCNDCELAKHRCTSFPISNTRTLFPFTLIHSDFWGPSTVPNIYRLGGLCLLLMIAPMHCGYISYEK